MPNELEAKKKSPRVPAPKSNNKELVQNAMLVQAFALDLATRVDNSNPESMRKAFIEYFRYCSEIGQPITNTTAYMAMGITNTQAYRYLNGIRRATDERFRELIEFVNMCCASTRETLMAQGGMNAVAGIWFGKNYDNLSDNPAPRIDNESDPLGELQSIDDIKSKYGDALISDSDYLEMDFSKNRDAFGDKIEPEAETELDEP